MLSASTGDPMDAVAILDGQTLLVRADDSGRQVRVSADPLFAPSSGQLRVEVGKAQIGSFAGVQAVRLEGGAGADELIVSPDVPVPVTIRGGGGDDSIVAGNSTVIIDTGSAENGGQDAIWAGRTTKLTFTDPKSPLAKQRINRLPAAFSVINSTEPTAASLVMGTKSVLGSVGRTIGSAVSSVARTIASGASQVASTVKSAVTNAVRKDVRATLRQPSLTKMASRLVDYSSNPLFGAGGPREADIGQGALNDCYVLAALAAVVRTDPAIIRRVITDLGDGTYAVRLMTGGAASYFRVDASLPSLPGVTPRVAYAQLGEGSALWVPLVEKALALAWGGSYTKLDTGGWMTKVFSALGVAGATLAGGPSLGLLAVVGQKLDAGYAVTLATKPKLRGNAALQLVENHAYAVENVAFNANGVPVSVTLRNPYNWDGAGGVITVDALSVVRALNAVVTGKL